MQRFHPVQHRWKAHKGTDYAVPEVPYIHDSIWSGRKTGYTAGNGNYVKKHNGMYSTHTFTCQNFVRQGQRVNKEMLLAGR
jgi:murein DD-endopeptidase MepM/ murein hydrolase activator NlpD